LALVGSAHPAPMAAHEFMVFQHLTESTPAGTRGHKATGEPKPPRDAPH
jgi:hypothetical protein